MSVQAYRLPIDRLERPHAAGLLAGARSTRELPPGAKATAKDSIAQAASRTGAHLGPPIVAVLLVCLYVYMFETMCSQERTHFCQRPQTDRLRQTDRSERADGGGMCICSRPASALPAQLPRGGTVASFLWSPRRRPQNSSLCVCVCVCVKMYIVVWPCAAVHQVLIALGAVHAGIYCP